MTIASENSDEVINPPKPDFFESTLNEIKLHKTNKTKPIESCRLQGNLWLLELRKYNRNIQIRNKAVKDLTCDYKLKVDQKFLTLQNLLYQIKKCYDYQSQYDDIYWIPLEQFLKIKPEFSDNAEDFGMQKEDCNYKNGVDMDINVSEEAKIESEHRLMIARMEWELEQRKSLNLKYTEMLKKKLLIESDIRDKQKLLANIYPTLTNALKASQPLQKFFKLDFEKDYKYADLLYTIPLPLYLIYTKWQAYINLFEDNGVDLEIIEGDEVNLQDITGSMVKNLEKIIKLSREQLLQKSETHEMDNIVSEEMLLNYEDDHTNDNKSRTALSTNDQRYGDVKEVYGTILDCDLRNCLTPSKYSIKVSLKMDAQRFEAIKCMTVDGTNGQSFSTEFNIYFYPKLNVLTIKAQVIDESEDTDTIGRSQDVGLKAWNSLKQKLLLDLDLMNQSNIQYEVIDEGSTLSSSYHLPKLIKALIGVENMCQETSQLQTLDRCLSLIFDQIGHPFFWLENLGGLVNTIESKANCSTTLREYYSLHVIKRVVDSLTQRLASRLHIKHLISGIGEFVKDHAITENKKHHVLPEILKISWAEPKLEDGHYILGALNLATFISAQNLAGPGLKVTVSLTIPLNCDSSCSHGGHLDDSNRAKATPTISFGAYEIVASNKEGGADGSRQKLADLKVKASLYQAFKELEKKINAEQIKSTEIDKHPCALAYRLGRGLRGVSEIANILNESDPNFDNLASDQERNHKRNPRLKLGSDVQEDKSLNIDMETIFYP